MLFHSKMDMFYPMNTTGKAVIDRRCPKYRPTYHLTAIWNYYNIGKTHTIGFSFRKNKSPVRIVLKAPFHYKKPKHRVSNTSRSLVTRVTCRVGRCGQPTDLRGVGGLLGRVDSRNTLLSGAVYGVGALPINSYRQKIVINVSLW